MRIKELEDVLILVDELPREYQLVCAEELSKTVQDWEGQQAEGIESYAEWIHLSSLRSRETLLRSIEERRTRKKPPE